MSGKFLCSIFIGVLFLAGCDGAKDNVAVNKNVEQSSEKNTADEKYSLFVKAFNLSVDGKMTENLNKFMGNDFSNKDIPFVEYLDGYYITPSIQALNAGLTIKTSSSELNVLAEKAQGYLAALEAFEPIDNQMKQYIQAKGYLNEGVAERQEKAEQYITAYKSLLHANNEFYVEIQKVDAERSKAAYESAPDNSIEKTVAGLVWHGKQSISDFDQLMTLSKAKKEDYSQLISATNALESDLAPIIGSKDPGCISLTNYVNGYLGALRSFTQYAIDDAAKAPSSSGWVNAVGERYNSMVGAINQHGCKSPQ
ncbi:hypothetical protein Z042_04565 [Chania multitudinisentens RB-25]|uniref:Lipoprotein n=1 Tax=Chania multitudinisentens RB-25 TaxID=1441930 RepID=W0LJP0_9GAMM|nr:YiiG family protein [Chania multitudinisentens]AHG22654.1 hypothetical protein Z042_04565 [Chania multitudinisentens RB-25]